MISNHHLFSNRLVALSLMSLIAVIFAFCTVAGRGQEADVAPDQSTFGAGDSLAMDDTMEKESSVASESLIQRTIKYVGKYHLMVLHFPIAFLLAAMLVQWYAVVTGREGSLVAALLWFGMLGSIAAAVLGWMYAYDSVYFGEDETILLWHRWLGTGTAVGAVVVTLFRKRLGPKALGVALTVCAGLVAAAAHFGGSLVYGADFLKKF